MMLQHDVRHLVVVDKKDNDKDKGSKPIGMITPLDLRDEQYRHDALRLLSYFHKFGSVHRENPQYNSSMTVV